MENPLTQVQDLQLGVRLMRAPTTAEEALAGLLLGEAWDEIRGRVPALDDRFAAGLVTEGQVRKVMAAMVVRVLRNPDAIRQWSTDDTAFTRDTALSAGLLYVTDDELELLSGVPRQGGHISFSAPMPNGWSR